MRIFIGLLALPALLLPLACFLYIIVHALPALHWELIVGSSPSSGAAGTYLVMGVMLGMVYGAKSVVHY